MTQTTTALNKHPKLATLVRRTASTLGLWVVVLAVILTASKPGFLLVMGAIALVALMEFYQIAQARGVRPFKWTGLVCGALLIVASYFAREYAKNPGMQHLDSFIFTLALCCLASIVVWQRRKAAELVQGGVYTIFGFIYVIWLFTYLIKIVFLFPEADARAGFWYVLFLLVITKFSDMGAYLVGSAIGRHKVVSWVSPNKTAEGFVGALIFAQIGALGCLFVLGSGPEGLHNLTYVHASVLGLLLGITAVIGDLVESVFKRGSEVKDSGAVLPGIGGMLDLVDSILFTAPLLYFYLLFFVVGT
jgi:phosphatidate cytidylyltransferase